MSLLKRLDAEGELLSHELGSETRSRLVITAIR